MSILGIVSVKTVITEIFLQESYTEKLISDKITILWNIFLQLFSILSNVLT